MKKKDRIDLRVSIIQADIIEMISSLMDMDDSITQTIIANEMGKSRSFISQLFSGNKTINLNHLAHFERIFNKKVKFQLIDPAYSTKSFNLYSLPELERSGQKLESVYKRDYSVSKVPKKGDRKHEKVA